MTESPSIAVWECLAIVGFARVAAAGIVAGSRLFPMGTRREWRERLVDPSPGARAASAATYRRRWLEFVLILLLGIPALATSGIGAPADRQLTTGIVIGFAAVAGGFLLWRLHRFEVEGRARWRQRLLDGSEERVAE